jgi:tagaturonate reductase
MLLKETMNITNETTNRPEKILQFGEGNFLRAFTCWMVDLLNEKAAFNGNIVMVKPRAGESEPAFAAQNCRYTTVLRGLQNGVVREEFRQITSVSRYLNPSAHYEDYLKCAENPDLRFVVSNTTEAGIAYDAHDAFGEPQKSFPAKVTAFLYRRFEHFSGDTGKALVFLPCELIENNGDKLKELVLRYADEWQLGASFRAWIDSCVFCNTLVDRIVSGYPAGEAETLRKKIGYDDKLIVAGEIFYLWVIECPASAKNIRAELPFDKAGLNVIWADDLTFYRTRKVRILNGAHTSAVLAAFLYGLDTVEQCIKDPVVSAFMRKAIFDEIIPSMADSTGGETEELTAFARDVLERFANPYIRHLLLSISLNSVSKFKTRVLPSLTGYIKKRGTFPDALVFSLAALIAFYDGGGNAEGGLTGKRGDEAYPIKDDEAVLKRFAALYADAVKSGDGAQEVAARKVAHGVLASADWWGEDLTLYAGLEDALAAHLAIIRKDGMKSAIKRVIS